MLSGHDSSVGLDVDSLVAKSLSSLKSRQCLPVLSQCMSLGRVWVGRHNYFPAILDSLSHHLAINRECKSCCQSWPFPWQSAAAPLCQCNWSKLKSALINPTSVHASQFSEDISWSDGRWYNVFCRDVNQSWRPGWPTTSSSWLDLPSQLFSLRYSLIFTACHYHWNIHWYSVHVTHWGIHSYSLHVIIIGIFTGIQYMSLIEVFTHIHCIIFSCHDILAFSAVFRQIGTKIFHQLAGPKKSSDQHLFSLRHYHWHYLSATDIFRHIHFISSSQHFSWECLMQHDVILPEVKNTFVWRFFPNQLTAFSGFSGYYVQWYLGFLNLTCY